jgi:hypothetical protein
LTGLRGGPRLPPAAGRAAGQVWECGMRDFFIRGFEAILSIVLIIAAIGIVAVAGLAAFGNATAIEGLPTGASGPVAGLVILVVGFIGLLVYGGLLYLGLGIYHNTRRTADALEMRGAMR